jgi:hypothetical protein
MRRFAPARITGEEQPMTTRRRSLAIVLSALAVITGVTPVLAARPGSDTTTTIVGGGDDEEAYLPLTDEEQPTVSERLSAAGTIAETTSPSGIRGGGSGRVSTESTCATSGTLDAPTTDSVTASSCVYVPSSYVLTTYARQQTTDYYCGPATAQVIINRTRGIYSSSTLGNSTTTNWKTQAALAKVMKWWNSKKGIWENVDQAGQTNAYMMKAGLNAEARLPSGFAYGIVYPSSGSQWHSMVITDIYQWKMPFATPIKMDRYHPLLTSWRSLPEAEIWHWIPIRGYAGFWDGSANPQVHYNDSSANQGGGTGAYRDSSTKLYALNQNNSGRIVW